MGLLYYATSNGCGRRRESTTRLLFSYIGVCTDLLRRRPTCLLRASRTCRRDSDYIRSWSSDMLAVSIRRTCPLSATALSRLLLHETGTRLRTFVHPALCQLSSVGSRPSSSHEASLTDATAWIFVLLVRWPRSFGLCHPNLFVLLL